MKFENILSDFANSLTGAYEGDCPISSITLNHKLFRKMQLESIKDSAWSHVPVDEFTLGDTFEYQLISGRVTIKCDIEAEIKELEDEKKKLDIRISSLQDLRK